MHITVLSTLFSTIFSGILILQGPSPFYYTKNQFMFSLLISSAVTTAFPQC